MRLLPKVAFKWKEPKDFVVAEDAPLRLQWRWWHRPLLVAALASLVLVKWHLNKSDPKKHPPAFSRALPVALAYSGFIIYLLPWVCSIIPRKIRFCDARHIGVSRRGHTRHIKYSDIVSFGWELHDSFAVLKLKHRRGGEFRLGVPLDVPREAVTTFLAERCPAAEYRGYHAGPSEAKT
jgi:hypothetical protein